VNVESGDLAWTAGSGEDRLSVFLRRLRRSWLLAAACVLLSTAVATTLAFVLPSYWRVEMMVMPVKPGAGLASLDLSGVSGLLGGAGLAGIGASLLGGKSQSNEDEALAVLASREIFDAYATRENLLPVLFDSKWDAANNRWDVSGDRIPTLRRGYKLFNRSIRDITLDRRSGIVTFAITWKDRELAVKWARDLVALTNEQMRQRALSEASQNMRYLSEAMKNLPNQNGSNALNSTLANAYERALQSYMYAQGQTEYAFRVIDPPTVPDARERVFPQRILFVVLGALAGMLLTVIIVSLRGGSEVDG
jgi:uncharacterized protein involved in exopolysaccharide biosynthesis